MSVIVGISRRSDCTVENAAYRLLVELAYPRATDDDDRRVLNAGMWTHIVDLTRLDGDQASRIAWLLDGAAQSRIDEWRAGMAEWGLTTAAGAAAVADYETLQSLLRDTFGRQPAAIPIETDPAVDAGPISAAEAPAAAAPEPIAAPEPAGEVETFEEVEARPRS